MYLCVTNRKLCRMDFLKKIESLCQNPEIEKIILREKDLSKEEYQSLAEQCLFICNQNQKPLVIHHFLQVAKELAVLDVHISMNVFLQEQNALSAFRSVGVSIHTVEEGKKAESLGADYLIAGHIFETDCKKGIPPGGLAFLKEVCHEVSIPVYGIGGISEHNIQKVLDAGAAGGCIMSGYMK